MSHKLADEILSMILAPSLTIPDGQFTSASRGSFGRNDNLSSSTILVVCKRWMRIATPLLYEVVVLRSTGQAHALADAFKANTNFGQYVRKIRLEGAYSRLFEVFKRCTRLHSLFFILDDIMSADNVNALCRSLPVINPTRVIFLDEDTTDFQGDNANKRKLFAVLCESIPKWTQLREFHYPYSHNPFSMTPVFETSDTRRSRLANALTCSLSLEEVHAETPWAWDSVWSRLASNDRIRFHFHMEPCADEDYDHFLDTLSTQPHLKRVITYKREALPLPTDNLSNSFFTPLASADHNTGEAIWIRIFAFALLRDHPDTTKLPDAIRNLDQATLLTMVGMRHTISLVCKQWHHMLERFFLSAPLLTTSTALVSLTNRILADPTLGPQILTFSLQVIEDLPEQYEETLCALFSRLTGLRHFIGFEGLPSRAFQMLASSAGKTLMTALNVDIDDTEEISPTILHRFECVRDLHLRTFPSLQSEPGYLRHGCLVTVQSLHFGNMSRYASFFASLRFPSLVKVTFSMATFNEMLFLQTCGSRVIHLEVVIYEPNSSEDLTVELLRLCLNLKTLQIGNTLQELHCPRFVANSEGNDTLRDILIAGILGYPGDKVTTAELDGLFAALPVERFPNLEKIQFIDYQWPDLHRDIDRDHLIKIAIRLKERHGLTVTDRTGKPFRPRVQRRQRLR